MTDPCFHSKKETPTRPGTYWVHNMSPRQRGNAIELIHTDSGYARWNGECWDRDDWDCWYYNEPHSSFPTGSLRRAV